MPAFSYCPTCAAQLAADSRDPFAAQRCPSCGTIHYHNSKPTVEALILRDQYLLLAERGVEPFLGYWDIPGGFLEAGEHPLDGLRREVFEETGLEVQAADLFTIQIDRYGIAGDYTLNLCYVVQAQGEPRPADDVASLRWFSLAELPKRIAFDHARHVLHQLVIKQNEEQGRV